MTLRNAHIEEPLRVGLLEYCQASAFLHGGGDSTDAAVLPGAIAEGLAEYGGKGLSGCFFQKPGFRIKGRDPMELAGVPLREGVSLTLLGMDMDHHRAGELLGPCQHIAQAGQVMAVDGSQIGEAHILKESASRPQCLFQAGFQPMVKAIDGGLGGRLSKEAPIPFLKVVVGRFAAQLGKMIRQSPHIGVDGHAVVIQKNDHMLTGGPDVVQTLVGQSAGEGAVTDQRHDLIILVLQGPCPRHTQRHGNGVGGVAGDEGIMDAFVGLGKPGKAVQLPQCRKQCLTAGEDLVDVGLMPHVEHKAVMGGVKDPVDRHRQLHNAQIGGKVSACFRHVFQQKLPQLLTKLRQLILIECPDILRGMNGIQNHNDLLRLYGSAKTQPR